MDQFGLLGPVKVDEEVRAHIGHYSFGEQLGAEKELNNRVGFHIVTFPTMSTRFDWKLCDYLIQTELLGKTSFLISSHIIESCSIRL